VATEKVRRWRGMLITLGHDRTGFWHYDLYSPRERRLGKGDGYVGHRAALAAARAEANRHTGGCSMDDIRTYRCSRCGAIEHVRAGEPRRCRDCGGRLIPDDEPQVTPAVEQLALRPEVLRLAQEMERQLRAHDDRPGWKTEPLFYLYGRMLEETHELSAVIMDAADPCVVWHEAADVANMAMMVADAYEQQHDHLIGWHKVPDDG
jgi:DNA-directed RNA polymerase subunit RPC12/RpoP